MLVSSLLALVAGAAVAAAVQKPTKLHLTGHVNPEQALSFVYVPFEVPKGASSLYVDYDYSGKTNGNSMDIGIFGQAGTALMDANNGSFGTRGWSGGARSNFTINTSFATPGYNPGPITPGTWNVAFGPYDVNADGIDWTLKIEVGYEHPEAWFSGAYPNTNLDPVPYFGGSRRWLRGDLHAHTVYSDGGYTPQQQIANALARDLDFFFFSEHNTNAGIEIYGLYQPPNLLIGQAIEVTTRSGHWQALGVARDRNYDWRGAPGDPSVFQAVAAQVHKDGGLVSINHPFETCLACNWSLDWDHNQAIELWNGPWDPPDDHTVAFWQENLVAGKRMTAVGGSDAHRPPDVTALPTTVVFSDGWNQHAVLDAIRQGFVYIVQGPGMSMGLTIEVDGRSHHIGQTVSAKKSAGAKAELELVGFDGMKACWVTDKGYVKNVTIKGDETLTFKVDDIKFLRAEVRDTDGSGLGFTNPLFFS